MSRKVVKCAEPYDILWLKYSRWMLIKQYNFPLEYDDKKDVLCSFCQKDSSENLNLLIWSKNEKNDKNILDFLAGIVRIGNIKWTGYRILVSAGKGINKGLLIWTLELFIEHPESSTKVFSGYAVPNVRRDFRQ